MPPCHLCLTYSESASICSELRGTKFRSLPWCDCDESCFRKSCCSSKAKFALFQFLYPFSRVRSSPSDSTKRCRFPRKEFLIERPLLLSLLPLLLRLSTGLQPMHWQYLHPSCGRGIRRCWRGTWHGQPYTAISK